MTTPLAGARPLVYWRPGCMFCLKMRLGLRLRGVDHDAVNIWRDDDARATVRSHAGGNETVPTVVIGGEHLVNPSVREVVRRARAAEGAAPR